MNELSRRALKSFSGVGAVEPWARWSALLLIDMQVACVRPEGYYVRGFLEKGLEDAVCQYQGQLRIVIPNLVRILERFRQNKQMTFHTHLVSLPSRQGWGGTTANRGIFLSRTDQQIIEELGPEPGEFVLPKASLNVFVGTNLDFLLRRHGITSLVIGGVVTNGCVEQAVGHAYDLGYSCVLVRDGCAAVTHELHEDALERLEDRRAHIVDAATLMRTEHVQASR